MARRRRDREEEPPEEGEQEEAEEAGTGESKRPSRRRPKLGNPDADPVKIHREYVERRLGGGGEASAEAYDEALGQWQRIPGAVSRPPAEVRTPEPRSEPDESQAQDEPDDDRRDESST